MRTILASWKLMLLVFDALILVYWKSMLLEVDALGS